MNNLIILAASEGKYVTNNILTNIINFAAPLVAIALVFYCVTVGFKVWKGEKPIKDFVLGILFLLFIIGVMFAAGSFENYGKLFQGITDKAINEVNDNAGKILE